MLDFRKMSPQSSCGPPLSETRGDSGGNAHLFSFFHVSFCRCYSGILLTSYLRDTPQLLFCLECPIILGIEALISRSHRQAGKFSLWLTVKASLAGGHESYGSTPPAKWPATHLRSKPYLQQSKSPPCQKHHSRSHWGLHQHSQAPC